MEYLSFKEAFRDARKAGDKTFTFQGKRYTTATAEENAPKKAADTGAYRGRRSEGANEAPKRESEDIPKSAEKAPAATGGRTSGPSNLERILLPLGVGAGVAGAGYKMYKTAQAAKAAKESERMATKAAMEFGRGKAAQVSRDTGSKFTAKQEMEAAESTMRGATNRRLLAEAKTERSKAAEAAKDKMKEEAKKKASPRSRTEEKEDIEFRKGGAVKKPAMKKPMKKGMR